MPNRVSPTGSELFIVDNSDVDWKVLRYLHDWCQLSKSIDIATGYFEIGSLLALKDEWQKVDHIRILKGDEASMRTRNAFVRGLADIEAQLDNSLEEEKRNNDFLQGVPAIVEAIRSGKITCRVYRKEKFHAKAYITHARLDVVGASALVGSSNFTLPGITENIELNVQITGRPVSVLQEWYEEHWRNAEDVTPEILRVIERHIREHSPFVVYAKSLQEFFSGHEMTVGEWEQKESRIYSILDTYQREGYQSLIKVGNHFSGAFLCDGVGLGKTFIGMMLIERLILHDRKRVLLVVPKAARGPVWERAIRKYLRHIGSGDYSSLAILNHSDLQREGDFPERIARIKEMADVVVIDEAHHFRNPGQTGNLESALAVVRGGSNRRGQIMGSEESRPSRYWRLFDLVEGKQLYMLTATPINNSLLDFKHMVELFSRRRPDYFKDAPVGIHSLDGHFRKLKKELEKMSIGRSAVEGIGDSLPETNLVEAERVLSHDAIFRALVVQRSRAYVRESQLQQGASLAMFPVREPPRVGEYRLKVVYGRLLDLLEKAFSKDKPLFNLAIYYPLAYPSTKRTDIDPFIENRQKQVVSLIRTQFLKRFESSAHAFQCSCVRLFLHLLAFVQRHSESPTEKRRLERWRDQNQEILDYIKGHQTRWRIEEGEDPDEDVVSDEMLESIDELSRDEYAVDEIIAETFLDIDQLVDFFEELKKFKVRNDDKLKALVKLLQTDPVLSAHKVLIFTEFADTAHYLRDELRENGIAGVDEVDSSTKRDRGDIIRQFAPYYNGATSAGLANDGLAETRVLISTDVLSEGLNLQDATRLINYDIHWNPVRLMQRIGRVDRRMSPEIEAKLISDHPDQAVLRGKVVYWNFLPPEELDELLRLYSRVSKKTLRISKTFGIEGRKLLKPEDDYEALREFNADYEGSPTQLEQMHLEFQQLLRDNPGLEDRLRLLPLKVFSGKKHPSIDAKAVFFCYALPARPVGDSASQDGTAEQWSIDQGHVNWYLYSLETGEITCEPGDIVGVIRSTPETPRHCTIERKTLSSIRAEIEKHIKNTYLKQVQAPVGVKPVLKAWMELS